MMVKKIHKKEDVERIAQKRHGAHIYKSREKIYRPVALAVTIMAMTNIGTSNSAMIKQSVKDAIIIKSVDYSIYNTKEYLTGTVINKTDTMFGIIRITIKCNGNNNNIVKKINITEHLDDSEQYDTDNSIANKFYIIKPGQKYSFKKEVNFKNNVNTCRHDGSVKSIPAVNMVK